MEREVFKILDELKAEGKIRFYGISTNSIDDAFLCLSYSDISVLEIEFNLLNREPRKELFPFLEKKQTRDNCKSSTCKRAVNTEGQGENGALAYNKEPSHEHKTN